VGDKKTLTSRDLIEGRSLADRVRAINEGGRNGPVIVNPTLRRHAAKNDVCPECGGALDTGWECNDCGYDAQHLIEGRPHD
jgi:tRNA(Ile2) C34 agmatinyltransferase TiaS